MGPLRCLLAVPIHVSATVTSERSVGRSNRSSPAGATGAGREVCHDRHDMSRTPFFLAAGAAALLASSVSRDAHAIGPVDVEVGAIAGAGTSPSGGGDPNPLGFGLGGRAGVALFGRSGLYVGVEGGYYFGSSITGVVKHDSYFYGVDVGYNSKGDHVTIRPLVGIGGLTERVTLLPPAGGYPSNPTIGTLYVAPGLTVLVPFGALFLGADANLLVLTSVPQGGAAAEPEFAFTAHAQIGVRF